MPKIYLTLILTIALVFFIKPVEIAQEIHKPIIKTEVIVKKKSKPKTVVIKPKKGVKIEPITPPTRDVDQAKVILLAKLIQSEALSESYEGKVWVGATVINRMRVYNKSLSEVIYQKYQFSGIHSDLFNSDPSMSCMKAATEVLNGNLPSREVLYFVDLSLCNPSWINDVERITKIQTHTFYREK